LGLFFGIGTILPTLNSLSKQTSVNRQDNTYEYAYQALLDEKLVTEENWTAFRNDPNQIVIKGYAYHAKFYRISLINQGNKTFELMVLSGNQVYPIFLFDLSPDAILNDGCKFIIVD
jgi:hypothetical protein